MRASNKEDSQRTTTLTDNKKRDYENEGSSMHEDSCIGINYAHMFPKCFRSLHTLLGFALYFVSSIQVLSLYLFTRFLTCTRIPCRDSHCENGSFEVLSFHFLWVPICSDSVVDDIEFLQERLHQGRVTHDVAVIHAPQVSGPPSWKLAVSCT